jgi:predicted Zn-dependent peptidase
MLSSTRAAARLARRSFATVVDAGGIKVAAVDSNQPTVAVTILAKAGSRYQQKSGVAHALKNFAFKVRIPQIFSTKSLQFYLEYGGSLCTRDSARE